MKLSASSWLSICLYSLGVIAFNAQNADGGWNFFPWNVWAATKVESPKKLSTSPTEPFQLPRQSKQAYGDKEIIDPKDTVCLPRYTCGQQNLRSQLDNNVPFLDQLNDATEKGENFVSFALLADIPSDSLRPNGSTSLGGFDIDAVIAEVDEDSNKFIFGMKKECSKDQLEFCAGNKYKSGDHTMCKYCGLGKKCPYYLDPSTNDVTGRVIDDQKTIDYILKLHNEVRSKIAMGRCDQPKAGCMWPLEWDPELARVAQKWADQCANVDYRNDVKRKDPFLFHDEHAQRKIEKFSNWQGVGQNVARDIAQGTAGQFDAHKLIGHWFNQILFFDPEAVKSFGSGNQCSKGIGYYTQLVWQDTTHVGCGWTQFQYRGFPGYYENFLVCNYGPSANVWKQPVYDIAKETCNCPCINCNPKTGMCPPACRFAVWSSWESWSDCSATCGGGQRSRDRQCVESRVPPPDEFWTKRAIDAYGSLSFVPRQKDVSIDPKRVLDPKWCKRGSPTEKATCNDVACPTWTNWGEWSECSRTCGGGEQRRERVCESASQRLSYAKSTSVCPGEGTEVKVCNSNQCPELTPWSSWTQCSKTCGTGERTRARECKIIDKREANACGNAPLLERETCNAQKCPIYTEWSEWSQCSVTCGGGEQTRERSCVLPPISPFYAKELLCNGPPRETRSCGTNDCPSWSEWSPWSSCSLTCGGGSSTRSRKCALPNKTVVPATQCQGGKESETKQCNEKKCPELGPWSEWSECSKSCGGGQQSRMRECGLSLDARSPENPCKASLDESRPCNPDPCPEFGPWSSWTPCSVTCGGGNQTRSRECLPHDDPSVSARIKALYCDGLSLQSQGCNTNECPVWTEWTEWTACSVTCGGGKRQKTRECVLPGGGRSADLFCPGDDLMEENCNQDKCPELGPWAEWTQCSLTCGGGTRRRQRECGLPKVRGLIDNPCKKPLSEEESCNEGKCPTVSSWSAWSECSRSCGGGLRKKTRECVLHEGLFYAVDNPCNVPLEVMEECNAVTCPMWTEWGEWTDCSKTCGGGKKRKYRQCVDHRGSLVDSSNCPGDEVLAKDCSTQECPSWTDWTDWTECSATCGGGERSRIRECIVSEPSIDDDTRKTSANLCAGDAIETETCNRNDCPIWTDWSEWTECSATCGGGQQRRVRDCILPKALSEDGCDGESEEIRECNANKCPVWTDWTEWSPCTKSCGIGTRLKTRQCVLPASLGPERIGLFCTGDAELAEECNVQSCPVPSKWSEWGECSKSCGGGTRTKVRECVNQRDAQGNPCKADLTETEACNEEPCPIWTEWTEWTSCSVTCGGGTRKKARECVLPKSDQLGCTGESEVVEACNLNTCPSLTPWTEWTPCSVTCGGGSQKRIRDCLIQRSGAESNPCFEELEETRECNADKCPKWTEWSEWTDCTDTCGGGSRSRVRDCIEDRSSLALDACGPGSRNETEACNPQPCPMWTDWTEWSQCSASCGSGTQHRARECTIPSINRDGGDLECDGLAFEDRKCNEQKCPQWTEWTPWSDCSKSCGGGTRVKTRSCPVSLARNDSPCGDEGSGAEISESCNEQPCLPDPAWSDWGDWSECSLTCGGGTKSRSRICEAPKGWRKRRNVDDAPCPGLSTMVMFCNMNDCPPETAWGPWGGWSECSKPCGGGERARSRECAVVQRDGQPTSCLGDSQEKGSCNDYPCVQWTDWGPWSSCSATCGKGLRSRYRKCKNLERDSSSTVDPTSNCIGEAEATEECFAGSCSTLDCGEISATTKFYSFSGRPATSIADCSWDYFGCTKRLGKWPSNKQCCTQRFDNCCMFVMGKLPMTTTTSSTTTSVSTSSTTLAVQESQVTTSPPLHSTTQVPGAKVELIDCIWSYFGCIEHKRKDEKSCKVDFNDCCMLSMGMPPDVTTTTTKRPISDIDLPELPDFLKPVSSSTARPPIPIQDIDLPDGASIIQPDEEQPAVVEKPEEEGYFGCLGRIYACEVSGNANCLKAERCLPPEAVVAEIETDRDPSTAPLSDGISICKAASSGKNSNILVPHPTDCGKFYSCQAIKISDGAWDWIAHEQLCPSTTGFDTELQICNFIEKLPRCYARKLF